MKALYVIDTLEVGGAERSLLEISSRLKHFTPVVCHIYEGDALRSAFEDKGIKVVSFQLSGRYQFIKAASMLRSLIKTERPDVVISTLYRSDIIARWVCWLVRVPQVSSIVSDTYSENKKSTFSPLGRIKFRMFYWLNRLMAGLPTAFIANSESIKTSVGSSLRISPEKVTVIYRGRSIPAAPSTMERKVKDGPSFLAVGRLVRGKGHEDVIRAFANFQRKYPQSTLTFAGEGPNRTTLEGMIASLKLEQQIILLGNISVVAALYEKYDSLVFASEYEGFSGVLVEAMMGGIPILASDIPMNKEAVKHLRTGFLFGAKDSVAIELAMEWFVTNREVAGSMAREAYAEAVARFDIEKIALQHEEFYTGLVRKFHSR